MKSITRSKHAFTESDLLTIDERIISSIRSTNPVELITYETLNTKQTGRIIQSQNMIDSSAYSRDVPIDTREADRLALAMVAATDRLSKASQQMPTAMYDYEEPYIAAKKKEDVTDTDALRRAIHSISNFYNTLGVYRSDFDKNFNDLMSRTAIYAMCEKAMADYMGSVPWNVVDRDKKSVEDAVEFLKYPNPQENFGTVTKMTMRDLMRYDAGTMVKSFSVGGRRGDHTKYSVDHPQKGYLLELKSYSGPEFWKEIDRVPMAINVPVAGNVPVQMNQQNAAHYTGWWSHGYTVRYWQRSRTGVYLPFQPEEVCYFMMYPTPDQIYGTDFLKYLRYQLQYLIDSTKAAGQTFANGVVPNLIWKHPQVRSTDQLTQRIAQMQAELKGPMKFGGAMHLVGEESLETMKFSLHDMEWLEGQKHFEQLVWAMWGFQPSEFIGDSTNRATAYVGRNITKSRLLYPLMRLFEDMINREILPYLQDYKKGWHFEFIKDIDLDDQQKLAHTTSIRWGSFSVARNSGVKPSLAYRATVLNEGLSESDLAEMDEQWQEQQQAMMMGGEPMDSGDQDAGRYGTGSEGYQPVSFSDYGQGGENTEQRMGESEETEHKTVKALVIGDEDYEILSEKDGIVKARVYVSDPAKVPKGRTAYHGARGRLYYITNVRTQKKLKPDATRKPQADTSAKKPALPPPEMPGDAKKTVKISGNGVALTIAEYSYGVEGKAAKNEATNKFVQMAKEKVADVPEEKKINAIKTLAKEEGLITEVQ
jgi:hypothetical protein